jgi:hypothetical protein
MLVQMVIIFLHAVISTCRQLKNFGIGMKLLCVAICYCLGFMVLKP